MDAEKYKEVLEAECGWESSGGYDTDGDCNHGYDWECDDCPITIERMKQQALVDGEKIMAGCDYLKCECGERLLYDGDGRFRDALEENSQSVTCAKCVKKMKNKIGMIEFAIDSGWVMTTSKNAYGYTATLRKSGFEPIGGPPECDVVRALERLSSIVEADYEKSMIEEQTCS